MLKYFALIVRQTVDLMSFYAVRRGRKPGVYQTWVECQEQVLKFPGPKFKKFAVESDAWAFVHDQPCTGESTQPSTSPQAGDSGIQDKLQSVLSTITLFKQQLTSLTSIGDKLTSEVEDLKVAVGCSGESFAAPHGVKRAFSADTKYCEPQPKKTDLKKNKSTGDNTDYFTGSKFGDHEGVVVYTDGACGQNGRNGARAGLGVYWGPGDDRNVSERLTGRPTNNRAEIHAARRAVEQAKASGIRNLVLHTDSQFLINSITTWIKGWKRNDWVKTTGEPVINKEDFLQLDSAIQGMNIKWVYVKGHGGNSGNEAADKLAVEGSKKSLPKK